MQGYGLKSLKIQKCSCLIMDWNAGNTCDKFDSFGIFIYAFKMFGKTYVMDFIHWEYRLKYWEIHMWWILFNRIMDWKAGKYTCNEFWSRIMDRKVFMAKVG